MKFKNDPFINIIPNLDVHGYTSDTVIFPVSDFINDNITLGNEKIAIIHGVGEGVLRKVIKEKFKKDKRINKLYLYNMNVGITIIELNMLK
jgi:dsDNA-specific endonuclease/ATPase MutS2